MITKNDIRNILIKHEVYDEVKNISLYRRALTHKSYVNTNDFLSTNHNYHNRNNKNIVPYQKNSNERLEFLGDSIIGHIICEYLYDRYPTKDEGFLTKLKTRLVDRKSLANFSKYMDISQFILISNHMENIHGRNTDKILEDIYESFICALYKDLGFMITKKFIIAVLENTTDFAKLLYIDVNFKDRLLRFFQKQGWETPVYTPGDMIGPSHRRTFTMYATRVVYDKIQGRKNIIKSDIVGVGVASSKKEAEQIASKEALRKFNALGEDE
jgi:dsRNA-specific ribonuclease